MNHDTYRELVQELVAIRKQIENAHKRTHNAIDRIKVNMDPEEWDQGFRIAAFLAIKDAELESEDSLFKNLFEEEDELEI